MRLRTFHLLALLLIPFSGANAGPFYADGNQYSGEAIACDLPVSEHLRNSVGRDGLGLCVFTSIELAARWANEPALIGFRDYMTKQQGGGWPERVDALIPTFAASKGLPVPEYVQHTGGDPEFLRLALKTGRYVCVTYNGRDGIFYRGSIAHMVNLVHFSDKWAVIQDNNFPGQWLWMTPTDFLNRWRGSGGGWAIVLLKAGPPPIPVNVRVQNPPPCPPPETEGGKEARTYPPSDTGRGQGGGLLRVEQCPNGVCPAPTNLEWHADPDNAGYFYLYRGPKQIGAWHPDGRGYLELLGDGNWSEARQPPIPLPTAAVSNFGLDVNRVSGEARYCLNGKEVSRREAFAAFGNLTDDSGKLRLTIVGDAELRQRVRADLAAHPDLLALRDRLLVQNYSPEHWAVAGVGFAPGITLQPAPDANGKAPVLFRAVVYQGPEHLAEAIRKADPNYRPENDPQPGKTNPSTPVDATPLPPSSKGTPMIPTELWYGLIGLIIPMIASRLGLPILGPPPHDLKGLVRTLLLDILKGLSQPQPAPDDEIRKQLQAVIGSKP